ncbi:MAG: DUF177 domain-containing protein [Fimbriimonadaceae bacterium]
MRRPGFLDLNEVVQHPGRSVTAPVSTSLETEEDLDLTRPVVGELHAVSTGNVLVVRLECTSTAVVECSRCGASTEFELEIVMTEDFTVEGIPSAYSADSYAEVECEEPDLFHGNSINLEEIVRQGVWLNMPAKPVCSGRCAEAAPSAVEQPGGHPGLQALREILEEGRT